MQELFCLILDSLHNLGVAVARGGHSDPRHHVEVVLAVHIPYVCTLCVVDHKRV